MDETEKADFHGVGVILTHREIGSEVIERAFNYLSAENPTDANIRTQNRGYFHASEDGRSAKRALARAVGELVSGVFIYSYRFNHEKKKKEREYRLHTLMCVTLATETGANLNIHFERRTQFNIDAARLVEQQTFEYFDKQAAHLPTFYSIYPKIVWTPCDKNNPGTQVADLVLWTVNNEIFDDKSRSVDAQELKKLMNASTSVSGKIPSNETEQEGRLGRYAINRQTPFFELERDRYPTKVNLNIRHEELPILLALVEQEIRKAAAFTPPHAQHLAEELVKVSEILRGTSQINPSQIQKMARIFLRIFDTFPIYKDLRKEDPAFVQLLRARHLMGSIFWEHVPSNPKTSKHLAELRNSVSSK
jgi:hypothetical protein